MQLIVVGGVPGAGKSTVLRPYVGRPGTLVLDPDDWRDRLRWRPLVHLVHQAAVWAAVLIGPRVVGRGLGPLLVHDTATRPRRRRLLLWSARHRGWEVRLVLVDVSRSDALVGQLDRGRLAPAAAFDRHWSRWVRLREQSAGAGTTVLVTRRTAGPVVADLVDRAGDAHGNRPPERDAREGAAVGCAA